MKGGEIKMTATKAVKRNYYSVEFLFPDEIVNQEILSDLIIPAVQGEFYSYSSKFTDERPLYAFMKCKANKNRPIDTIKDLGHEANLLFLFNKLEQIKVCPVKTAHTSGLLGNSVNSELLSNTFIAPAKITAEHFYNLYFKKDASKLMKISQESCLECKTSIIPLELEMIIAMMTDCGKYGLFLVKDLTSTSIQIDACHILL